MPIDNQIEPPQSFMALYTTPGRSRPNAPQDVVLARYELCEDMANMLTQRAQNLAFKEDVNEQDVLLRCLQGLRAEPAIFTQCEAEWVIVRLAELLGWQAPDLKPAT